MISDMKIGGFTTKLQGASRREPGIGGWEVRGQGIFRSRQDQFKKY